VIALTAIMDPTAKRPITATARLAFTEVLASRWKQATGASVISNSRAQTADKRHRATDMASAAIMMESANDDVLVVMCGMCVYRTKQLLPATRIANSTANVSLDTPALAVRILTRVLTATLASTVEPVR